MDLADFPLLGATFFVVLGVFFAMRSELSRFFAFLENCFCKALALLDDSL